MTYKMTEEDIEMFRDGDYKKFCETESKDTEGRFIVWDLKYTSYPTAIKCPECGGIAVQADDSSDYVCVNPVCDYKYYDAGDHLGDFAFYEQIED